MRPSVKEVYAVAMQDISFTSTSTSAYSSHKLLKISLINVRMPPLAAFTILYSDSQA